MKRQINANSQYNDYFTIQHGPRNFSVHFSDDGPYQGSFIAQISEIHPYDDAEYTWARIKYNGLVEFIRDGKLKDRMQLPGYDEEDYESVTDYYDDMLDSVAVDLIDMNKDVKPRMMYN